MSKKPDPTTEIKLELMEADRRGLESVEFSTEMREWEDGPHKAYVCTVSWGRQNYRVGVVSYKSYRDALDKMTTLSNRWDKPVHDAILKDINKTHENKEKSV